MVCPGGTFTTTVGGVQLRDGDGVHIIPTPAAGQWLAAHLLPPVVLVGRDRLAGRKPLAAPAGGPVDPEAHGVGLGRAARLGHRGP